MMLPVDMRGVGEEDFQDVEEMVEKLGPRGAAEGFIKAREYFEANNKDPDAKPMTAGDWRKVLEDDAMQDYGEGGEEAPWCEGEEEDLAEEDWGEEAEEEGGDAEGEEGDDEPDAKKAR